MGKDVHSYANFEEVVTTSLHLRFQCDFKTHQFHGMTDITCRTLIPSASCLSLDAKDLVIDSVCTLPEGHPVDYSYSDTNAFGGHLCLPLPSTPSSDQFTFRITYRTDPNAEAIQWLTPEQTAGGKAPFCFTQCQAIAARTLFPCQDTPAVKSPFTIEVTVPMDLNAVASGEIQGDAIIDQQAKTRTVVYHQSIPVMSYLVALCCGRLESAPIGPRSLVFAEPEMLEACREELDGVTEAFIGEGEKICGMPYQWGSFNVLVLPRCFAYGGMENPNLTFFSASLIAGDKSLTTTLAHEITHSWSGNWVTNAQWQDFWLNEGFTRYIERRVLGNMYGAPYRGLLLTVGYFDLVKAVQYLADNPNLTRLQPDLTNCNPDDAFCRIPYEKGSLFLHYLETVVGGQDQMSQWLKRYFEDFAKQSVETKDMRQHFSDYFANVGIDLSAVDWDHWLHGEGLPNYDLQCHIDSSLVTRCRQLADFWHEEGAGAHANDLSGLRAHQVMLILDNILNDALPLSSKVLAKMDSLYHLTPSKNVEVGFRWLLLNLRNQNKECYPALIKFVATHGRGSYVIPLFTALNSFDNRKASELFTANRTFYQAVIARRVAQVVGAIV